MSGRCGKRAWLWDFLRKLRQFFPCKIPKNMLIWENGSGLFPAGGTGRHIGKGIGQHGEKNFVF